MDNYSGFTNTIKVESDSKLEEGTPIPKNKGNQGNQSFTCPNPSCGRVFTKPIKAENLSLKNGTYDACPYCLTEITVEKSILITEETEKEKPTPLIEKSVKQEAQPTLERVHSETITKPDTCAHHFGYLSQRSTKEKIPEECMMCEKIVQCMLQRVKG
ncbi:MAG: hypothetical protein ACPL0C_01305 [Candidatus Bathyarchaeales archaeon]